MKFRSRGAHGANITAPITNKRYVGRVKTGVSRKEFGILYNPVLETGGVAVSDEVSIVLDIELIHN